ncbi:gliding motility-associated C-terminal domain-containing protein [Roseivirga sp.]|uniref:T9SS type B sorting domain-containing protein n=1 Tax=Roseivirga sp. TaxID=1964215 RepID=UPI003B8C562A
MLCITSVQGQVNTVGKDFWLGFTENEFIPGHSLEIWINAEERANVTILNPGGDFLNQKVVQPGRNSLVILPSELMASLAGKNDFGIHVTSDTDISVYAMNKRSASIDATAVLPTDALDTEYYAIAHVKTDTISNDAGESNIVIVATENATEIIVVPSVDTSEGWLAGETQTFTLDAGETYHVKSVDDLTGTLVRSIVGSDRICKKIAVFSGNKSTNVGDCGPTKDHLMEQMPPVSAWGREFLYVPFQSRSGGDLFKVLAGTDGTRVNIEGIGTIDLDAGEYHVIETLEGIRTISSNEPISMAQFSRSQACDGIPSDPFMIVLAPTAQGINEVNFSALPTFRSTTHYMTLVTTSDNLRNIVFDGVDITSEFTIKGNAAYANLVYQQGNHRLTAENGVLPYLYSFGEEESFGYLAGSSLGNLDLVQIAESLEIENDNQVCVNLPTNFAALFDVIPGQDPVFDTFQWDFGDGTLGLEQNAVHTYTQAGEYEIALTASSGRSLCNNAVTITKMITVRELAINEFVGPLSVCPEVTDIIYSVDGPAGNTYEWFIEGGTITSGGNSGSITVDWGIANDSAFIKVLPINLDQCNTDTLSFDVKINTALEPALPMSDGNDPNGICFGDFDNVTYSVNQTAGSEYEWFVDSHGEIIGSNLGNSVNIRWSGPGIGRVWYREFNPLISSCEGFSEQLVVTIHEPIVATPTISDVLCHGESNGTITLDISGGQPGDYKVIWDNGMTGVSIGDLPIGTYVATITDEIGCELVQSFEVNQPEVLEIIDAESNSTLCFQDNTGIAEIMAVGGVPFPDGEYRYLWEGNGTIRTTDTRQISGLRGGTYTVTVMDANNCEVSTSVTIDQPPLLEADLATLLNPAVCPQETNGTAFIGAKGGTPNYQFFWSNNPSVDDQSTSGLGKGSYTVRIVDANGCEASLNVNVAERFPKVVLPNAFSPNNDGVNDTFNAVTDCTLPYSMQVYNKWGTIVFSSNDIGSGWDGRFEGQEAPAGLYSYIVFYSVSINDKTFEETYRGTFKLIR